MWLRSVNLVLSVWRWRYRMEHLLATHSLALLPERWDVTHAKSLFKRRTVHNHTKSTGGDQKLSFLSYQAPSYASMTAQIWSGRISMTWTPLRKTRQAKSSLWRYGTLHSATGLSALSPLFCSITVINAKLFIWIQKVQAKSNCSFSEFWVWRSAAGGSHWDRVVWSGGPAADLWPRGIRSDPRDYTVSTRSPFLCEK